MATTVFSKPLSDQIAKRFLYTSSIQEIINAVPNNGDVVVVTGSTGISSELGFTSGVIVGICARVLSSTVNRVDFFFSQQNGKLSAGRIEISGSTYTVTYHTGTLSS